MATKFKPGDQVERIGEFVPIYKKYGMVIRVIADCDGIDVLNEYEVDFGNRLIDTVCESHLKPSGEPKQNSNSEGSGTQARSA
jgi:hypothetical protein